MSTETDREPPPPLETEEPLRDPNPENAPKPPVVRRSVLVIGAPVALAALLTAGALFGPVGVLLVLLVIAVLVLLLWWWRRRRREVEKDSKGKAKAKSKNKTKRERRQWGIPRWGGFGSTGRSSKRRNSGPSGSRSSKSTGPGGAGSGRSFGRIFGKRSGGNGPTGGGNGKGTRSKGAGMLKRARSALGRAQGGSRARQTGGSTKGRQRGAQGLFRRMAGRLGQRGGKTGPTTGQTGKTTKRRGLGRMVGKIGRGARKIAGRAAGSRAGRAIGKPLGAARRAIGRALKRRGKAGWATGPSVSGGGAVPRTRKRGARVPVGKRLRKLVRRPSFTAWRQKRANRKWQNENTRRRAERQRREFIPGPKPLPKPKSQPTDTPDRGDSGSEEPVYTGNQDDQDHGENVIPFRRPTRRNAKGSSMPNPYSGAIEALGGTITVENAMDALDYIYGLPALIAAAAERLTRDGSTYCNDFPTDPRAGEISQLIGQQMRKMHDPVEKFATVFERVHAKELERIRNPRHNERAWDVSQNVR